MINKQELRLGNWIYLTWEYFQFTKEAFNYHEQLLDPIPLTEKILMKCGFEKKQWDEIISIEINITASTYLAMGDKNGFLEVALCDGDFEIIRYRYVHQLQNLYFALTGEELKLDLKSL